jgi:hypothetical protein
MFQMFGHLEMIPHVTFRVLGHLAVHEDVNAVKSAGSQRNDVGSPAEFSGREKLFEFLLKHMDTVLVGFLATNWSYWCSTPCRSLMALESKLLS